ncbi:VanZ family protein [Microbacterium sp. CJ88]|uniref:VanZ family protein n=1 Tax=Microbacterium sp. CJ88 TaxID=3445672 RepID=UPI003F6581EC
MTSLTRPRPDHRGAVRSGLRASSIGPRLLAAAVASGAVLALTLAPQRYVGPARGAFMEAVAPMLVDWTYTEIENGLNALLFVPLGIALSLMLGRLWPLAVPAGLALSLAVEFAQSRIPGRVPDPLDVLWNTVGAIIGVAAAVAVRAAVRAARRARGAKRAAA